MTNELTLITIRPFGRHPFYRTLSVPAQSLEAADWTFCAATAEYLQACGPAKRPDVVLAKDRRRHNQYGELCGPPQHSQLLVPLPIHRCGPPPERPVQLI